MEDNFYQFGTFYLDSKYKIVIDIFTPFVFGVVHKWRHRGFWDNRAYASLKSLIRGGGVKNYQEAFKLT